MSQRDFFSSWKFCLPSRAKCSCVTMAVPMWSEWMCAFFTLQNEQTSAQLFPRLSRSIRLMAGGSERRTGTSASSPETTWWSCTLCSNMLCKFLCSYPESSEDFHFLQVFVSERHSRVTEKQKTKWDFFNCGLPHLVSCVIFRLLAVHWATDHKHEKINKSETQVQ